MNLRQQILNGAIDQQVLYNYDFGDPDESRAGELNERGHYQLEKLAFSMGSTGYPIVVQSTSSAELDEHRRQVVLQGLVDLGLDPTPDDVVVKRVTIEGLGGIGEREFPRTSSWSTTYENRLQQTRDRGSSRLLKSIGQ